jgi:hypothetical protein
LWNHSSWESLHQAVDAMLEQKFSSLFDDLDNLLSAAQLSDNPTEQPHTAVYHLFLCKTLPHRHSITNPYNFCYIQELYQQKQQPD